MHGAMMPGLINGHSHAFQFALRGRAERFGLVQGSFWSWRDAMYDLVDSLDADRCHELSLASFNEMIDHGVTSVGEFHYVRHDDAQDHRLDDAVMVAAEDAGIRTVDEYLRRLDTIQSRLDGHLQTVGMVAHSVRAVSIEDIVRLHRVSVERGLPFHIHVEEVLEEIESCQAAHGCTPMRLLLDRGVVTPNVVAIHCTHSQPEDMRDYVAAGGQVCLCPITEGNLGDGIADIPVMRECGASLSVGTDLNSRTDLLEELRWLEYVQRVARQKRGVIVDADGDTGRELLRIGTEGGARALGLDAGRIEAGALADLVLFDHEHDSLAAASEDELAAALIFGASGSVISRVIVDGVDT
jgi:formimidoylglutamate deiminase